MEGGAEEDAGNGERILEEADILRRLPEGYRFHAVDHELITNFLMKKVNNLPLPFHVISTVNLYEHAPEHYTERYPAWGGREWYFFTPRYRKYPKGDRPSREAGYGFWKATGGDYKIELNGQVVGLKKSLVYYKGTPTNNTKTPYVMQEYRLFKDETTGVIQGDVMLVREAGKPRKNNCGKNRGQVPIVEAGNKRKRTKTVVEGPSNMRADQFGNMTAAQLDDFEVGNTLSAASELREALPYSNSAIPARPLQTLLCSSPPALCPDDGMNNTTACSPQRGPCTEMIDGLAYEQNPLAPIPNAGGPKNASSGEAAAPDFSATSPYAWCDSLLNGVNIGDDDSSFLWRFDEDVGGDTDKDPSIPPV